MLLVLLLFLQFHRGVRAMRRQNFRPWVPRQCANHEPRLRQTVLNRGNNHPVLNNQVFLLHPCSYFYPATILILQNPRDHRRFRHGHQLNLWRGRRPLLIHPCLFL